MAINGTALSANASPSDTYRVGTALVDFILTLLNVSDKVKAAAELIKVLGEVATDAVASQRQTSESQRPSTASTPPLPSSPQRLNLRAVLDDLQVETVELSAANLLRILSTHVLLGSNWGVCVAASPVASDIPSWLAGKEKVARFVDGASLTIPANRSSAIIRFPQARRRGTGVLQVTETISLAAGPASILTIERNGVEGNLDVSLQFRPSARRELLRCGVRLRRGSSISALQIRFETPDGSTPQLLMDMLVLLPQAEPGEPPR